MFKLTHKPQLQQAQLMHILKEIAIAHQGGMLRHQKRVKSSLVSIFSCDQLKPDKFLRKTDKSLG